MRLLVVGDTHFTDKTRDAHRFDIFKWIKEERKQRKIEYVTFMGDIADSKDRHTATLVNKISDGLNILGCPAMILMGNHDYIDPNSPFFGFLSWMENLVFLNHPCRCFEFTGPAAIPHCRTQDQFDQAVEKLLKIYEEPPTTLFLHNTFTGAVSETGAVLSGLRPSWVDYFKPARVYAGDVHKPQTAGPVTYVGAPYHIRFGDDYKPRVLLLDGDKETELYFPAPKKWKLNITSPDDILGRNELKPGDQVKVTLELAREEIPEWKSMRARIADICREMGLEVYGISLKANTAIRKAKDVNRLHADPKEILASFALKENLSTPIKQAGLEFLK
ncbi:MAG TPA: metallophosphoesterase [Candidatus Angelobacter sp.]|nr:metallophosphoesterase [Candidatus Angelobacter sp.]